MHLRHRRRQFPSSVSPWVRAELRAQHSGLDHAHRYPGLNLLFEKLKMSMQHLSDDHPSGRQSFRRMRWVLHGTRLAPRLENLAQACVRGKALRRWISLKGQIRRTNPRQKVSRDLHPVANRGLDRSRCSTKSPMPLQLGLRRRHTDSKE